MIYEDKYNEIVDILLSAGINLNDVKIELNSLPKKNKGLTLLSKSTLNKLIRKVNKMIKNGDKNNTSNFAQIYTDGSCLENDSKHPGTFGLVVVFRNKIIFEYSNHDYVTTNNIMELSALIIATQIGNALANIKLRTLIYSDSQYAVNSLFGTWKGKANKAYIQIFEMMHVDRNRVKCEWCHAHSGIILNEMADKLCLLEYNKIKGYYVTKQNY